MKILDPGHIYEITIPRTRKTTILTFIKRSGGAITYLKEWPGIQTQAVMRALIKHLELLVYEPRTTHQYLLWQLGKARPHLLTLGGKKHVCEIIDVVIDRSWYLNNIINCAETQDACAWLEMAKSDLHDITEETYQQYLNAMQNVRMALWCYEARAYRRKQEHVNREQPTHDDTARPRPWRFHQCDDVPFNEDEIEQRMIGSDGHICLEKCND